jgi:hypothetical protein
MWDFETGLTILFRFAIVCVILLCIVAYCAGKYL